MIEPPPIPPSADQPHRQWPGLIAWAAIIIAVGLVMRRVATNYDNARKSGVESPTEEIQVGFAGRAAVGIKNFMSLAATAGPSSRPTTEPAEDMVISALKQVAKAPRERLRVIMVVGELTGAESAKELLAQFESTHPSDDLLADAQLLDTIYDARSADQLSTEDRQRLIDRHDFFGRLAVSFGKSDNDPLRTAVMHDATVAATRAFVTEVIGIILIIVVVIAAVVAIILAAVGKIVPRFVRQPSSNTAYVEAFAIYLVGFLTISWLLGRFTSGALSWDWLALVLIPLTMLWVRLRGQSDAAIKQGFGWFAGRGPHIEIPLGLFGYFAGVPVMVAGFFISFLLMKRFDVSPMHPIQQMLSGSRLSIINLYGIACIFAPVMEETMFRGALLNHLRRRWNWLTSASIVAFIFAAIHPQGWTLIPALGSIAMVLAAIREWRGTILAPIAAHACNNFIVLSLAILVTR